MRIDDDTTFRGWGKPTRAGKVPRPAKRVKAFKPAHVTQAAIERRRWRKAK